MMAIILFLCGRVLAKSRQRCAPGALILGARGIRSTPIWHSRRARRDSGLVTSVAALACHVMCGGAQFTARANGRCAAGARRSHRGQCRCACCHRVDGRCADEAGVRNRAPKLATRSLTIWSSKASVRICASPSSPLKRTRALSFVARGCLERQRHTAPRDPSEQKDGRCDLRSQITRWSVIAVESCTPSRSAMRS